MDPKKPHISIVSPVYGAQGIINELVDRVVEGLKPITDNYEIILVEDNSPDNSWHEIVQATKENSKVKGARLSRNFGQHNAISAGMEIAEGEYVVLLDCDLQHDPKYLETLYNKIQEGYDLVYTRTISREHSILKNGTAKLYYKFLKFISDFDMDPNIGSFSMLSRKVVDAFNQYNDYKKAYLWALKWAGFNFAIIDIEHNKRFAGSSAYSFKKLLVHALNVAVSNSDKLLYLSVYMGVGISLMSFFGVLYVVYRYFTVGGLEGWSSLMVMMMFFSGLILTAIGISSVYIAKVFEQTKGRPRYLISEKLNFND
jgi:glycosyltransferase involved in cell wall biosynthesis